MSQTFTYDDLNRLSQAVGSAYGTQSFAYDSIGNMTSKASRSMAYGEGAPGPHAVTSVTWSGTNFPTFCRDIASGSCTLGYDGNGNMTTRGADTLAYDSENRLKEMKTYEGDSGSTSYTLKPGWNVIAFTHLPDNRSVSNVLSSLIFGTDYDQVSTWDSGSSSWKHWVNDSDFNDFTQFEYGKTYEIYNNSGTDKSLTVTGRTRGTDITHSIVSGDNFISPAVKIATNVTTVLSSLTLGTHYSDVKRFNATTQAWESYQGGAFTQFEPGKGYNIIGLTNASFTYGKTESTTTFVYDSTGSRVKKTTGSTTTTYLGKDYDITGSTNTKYVFLGQRRIAIKDSSGVLLFNHEDHINSSNIVTDSSGNQAALLEYDPYGATVTHTGSANPKHKFTGQESDDSTKLYLYSWRYYDPQLGRFISPDTIIPNASNPQEFNRYSYVNNNPIKFNDPSGHKKQSFWRKLFRIIAPGASFLLEHPKVARFFGQAIYRAAQAYSQGADFKETVTAGLNGAGEVYGLTMHPGTLPDLFKGGPQTDSFSSDTRKMIQAALQSLGLDPITAKVGTWAIEATLTTGNRNYAEIKNNSTSVQVNYGFSFSYSGFTLHFGPNNKAGFSFAGFVGADGFHSEEPSFTFFTLAGFSYDVTIEFQNPRSMPGEKRTSFYMTLSPLGGEHNAISFEFAHTREGRIMLTALAISSGPSIGSPFGYERKPAKDMLPPVITTAKGESKG